ncbi:carboxypeptidase-like regulatory domain-containing protein [Odoribacter sp. OttesenSCG-928-L07]|nr:carboxypeptidase-like regulatory domain-containing protein [Odoribacter sp. OttesenSCG-928-L07]MDL2241024.1 carboxypeptidase-like regulatory domain-containing protein [Bacteroidales bacterium OttesenSCG-928-K22]
MTANRKQKFIRWLCTTISLTSVAFIFHACYGMPPGYGDNICFEGKVTSSKTGNPIQGIKVSVEDYEHYCHTNDDGTFNLYVPYDYRFKVIFSDIDSVENGQYLSKDTIVINNNIDNRIQLNVSLDEK